MNATPIAGRASPLKANRPQSEKAILSATANATVKAGPIELLREPYPGDPTREIVLLLATFSPGDSTPPHRHPGVLVGYVLAGELEFQLEGQPLQHLAAGDRFFEPPCSAHVVSHNPGPTTAQVLAFIIRNVGAPNMIPLSAPTPSAQKAAAPEPPESSPGSPPN
jgi:quercetin dioxygenase-like cupin family protein